MRRNCAEDIVKVEKVRHLGLKKSQDDVALFIPLDLRGGPVKFLPFIGAILN